jgi:glycerol uptake facilitator-like aquaporin
MSGKSYLVELLGTFALTFILGMVRITNQEDLLSVGLSTFFLMMTMVHTFFHISSAQFNPILSISLLITKQNSLNRGIIYVLMHLSGSFLAGTLLFLINRGKETGKYYGAPQMNAAMREAGLVFELVSMFLLVLVYNYFMSNVAAPKYVYGTAIAGVYTISIVGFGFISGGATNFAFIFGPSIFMENFKDWIYYFVGHLVGGIVSGIIYRLFLLQEEDEDEEDMIDDEEGIELKKQKVE